jgi:hypothetical protein
MFDNNIIFSLMISTISILSFFLISDKDEENYDKVTQNILILFGITFITTFILKSLNEGGSIMKGGGEIIAHSTRAPF